MHAVPFQVSDMCLREVLRLGHAEDGRLPKRLGLVVTIESLARVFGLADVDDRLSTRFVFAKEKVNARVIQFMAKLAGGQFAPRGQDRLYQPRRDIRDADSTRFSR